jgi:thiol-disulfide isomerase/thioredoxin
MSTPTGRRWLDHTITALIVALIAANIWWFFLRQNPETALEGALAPAFRLPTASDQGEPGPPIGLEGLRGKVVLLDFWATWCGPCKQQMPALQQLHEALPPDRFALLSINIDQLPPEPRRKAIAATVRARGVTYPVLLDDGRAQAAYGVERIPTAFLIDPRGRVARVHRGLLSAQELNDEVQRLLQAPEPTP